jgi:hypothetical protein
VPIPDIHGKLTDKEQAQWIVNALEGLFTESSLIGLNYWVGVGGSTQIWNDDGSPKPSAIVLRSYFSPVPFEGTVIDQYGRPIKNVTVLSSHKKTITNLDGQFSIPVIESDTKLSASRDGYASAELTIDKNPQNRTIIIEKKYTNLFELIIDRLQLLFSKLVKLASFSSL